MAARTRAPSAGPTGGRGRPLARQAGPPPPAVPDHPDPFLRAPGPTRAGENLTRLADCCRLLGERARGMRAALTGRRVPCTTARVAIGVERGRAARSSSGEKPVLCRAFLDPRRHAAQPRTQTPEEPRRVQDCAAGGGATYSVVGASRLVWFLERGRIFGTRRARGDRLPRFMARGAGGRAKLGTHSRDRPVGIGGAASRAIPPNRGYCQRGTTMAGPPDPPENMRHGIIPAVIRAGPA